MAIFSPRVHVHTYCARAHSRPQVCQSPELRIHLRLFEYRGKHAWPITHAAASSRPRQCPSVSKRIIRRARNKFQRSKLRYPPVRILSPLDFPLLESWEECHGSRSFSSLDTPRHRWVDSVPRIFPLALLLLDWITRSGLAVKIAPLVRSRSCEIFGEK